MDYIYAKYKYSNKIKLIRMLLVIAIAVTCFVVGGVRIFGHNPDAGAGFRGYAWFVLIVGGILVLVVGFFEIYREIPIDKVYPFIAITLGIIYIVLVPAFETPDEHDHFNSAYLVSDEYMSTDYNPSIEVDKKYGPVLVRDARYVDAKFPDTSFPERIDTSQYEAYISSLGNVSSEEDVMVRTTWKSSNEGFIMYYLPAVGVTFARILNLNFGYVYGFGALLNVIFYVLMTSYAIRKMPFGKRILFIIALLPITLQQAASFSYDSGTIACITVVIAQAFFLKYGDRSTRHNWKWNIEIPFIKVSVTELLMYVFCGFLLLNVKRGVFLIVFLLPIALCINKKWFTGRGKLITIPVIVIAIAGAAAYVVFLGGYAKVVTFLTAVPQDIRGTFGVSGVAPIEYINNPGRLFSLIINYVKEEKTHIFNQLGGGVLGFYRIFMSTKIAGFNLVLLLLSMIRYNKEDDRFHVGNRIVSFLIGLAPVVITFTAMLLYWTYPWDTKVEGFQGRYIIPTLSIMMLSVGRWQKIRIPNVDNLFIILMTVSSYAGMISVLGFV